MQFVHGLRAIERVAPRAVLHPLLVAPFIREVPDYRGCPWRYLAPERKGVALVDRIALVLRYDVILVQSTGADATQETPPDAGRVGSRFEAMRLRVPTVELSDHRDGGRIRSPDGKVGALFARFPGGGRMGTQLFVGPEIRAFAEEVDVLFR